MNTSIDISHIRNFSIVAHIDHGKSTISDRILELTHTVDERDMESQLLDTMDIERERGITIKSNAVRVSYDADDGETYQFNLIDTPGHVDFTYEVSRSLAACEGAVLVVDATQGVEAQTVSNATLAMNANLDIVPAINKIDLPSAHPDEVKTEIEDDLAIPADDAVCVSGKTGEGIHDLLESIVFLISPPKGDATAPLKALILDSYFDEYRGVVATVRVFDGSIKKGDTLRMMQAEGDFLVDGVGVKRPAETPVDALTVGEVGYVVTGLKDPEAVRVGDTLTWASNPCPEPLPGYREAKPMVYTGLFPIDNKDYENLRDALDKLHVNDPSLVWEPETSVALGFGFRVGFLGLLHMEVVKERLEREFNLDLIATSPSVDYHVYKTDGEMIDVRSPQDLPEATRIERIEEPYLKAKIICPPEYTGAVMQLAIEHRGITTDMIHLTSKSVEMRFDMPLAELILDFFDQLKSRTKGYASLDYEFNEYRPSELVKLDILLSGDEVDALSFIVHKDKAYGLARGLCDKLKEIIPRQLFEVPIQGAIGNKIIARSTVKARRKDVLAKCYGGDISRKRKLLEKQKEGKKRMKAIGSVEVPQEAFMAILKVDE
ncbi:translation elongation factor 4 [Collinsella sp. HCP3S3_B1]|jgi:GTP-binding protein LepA|uniref:translation elongation factor 4 n=1 Tax=unclassified Collinsella TaxID=2637548 RepID=UPI0012B43F12|nr:MULTISPECIES: translation elongation factor 4 [unclassified Collinsella]MCI6072970.1 translation elongation factor 4 [Collinsella sp.]MCI6247278.1 translation elongation factor 4 [Collinsella sp.]MCI6265129.1 translation elongation factor 4 [Collinsella sp.]MCI6311783.1 translation elongation factor 4 [Collinsella sp.]MCI6351509.1 translation elongation factor 4 [Collinsella sp.]